MKSIRQVLSCLTGLLLLPSISYAASCGASDQVFPWGDTAVQMMWSMRSWGCGNAWSGSTKVVPKGNWCFNGNSPCWNGWWFYHNHPSQQACWDVLEQIINQCMWAEYQPDNTVRSTNGGTWSRGSEYSEGWFYNVKSKRDVPVHDTNITLQSTGEVVAASRIVYLNFDEYGNVTGVANDIRLQEDGTFKEVS